MNNWKNRCLEAFSSQKPNNFLSRPITDLYDVEEVQAQAFLSKRWSEIDEEQLYKSQLIFVDLSGEGKAYYLATYIYVTTVLLGSSNFVSPDGITRKYGLWDFEDGINLICDMIANKDTKYEGLQNHQFLQYLTKTQLDILEDWLKHIASIEDVFENTDIDQEKLNRALQVLHR